MKWLALDPTVDPRELWELGARLHGHRGPFLAVGIRMGLLALRLLRSSGFTGIRAEAETGGKPPVSCLVDGLQIATGCTAGKGNLAVREGGRPAARFVSGDHAVRIALRDEVARALLDGGATEDQVEWILSAPVEELFTWESPPLS
ncbi:MAG: formylmethanofuran dehydrogenase subunit E family protein [Candidatus Acetothermia bacterium]|jgi:formylmethanofuran dehydrogenase subunit E|nr:formylmethanofuran dehydrogenase subunit E family protein [Candidatus Acetothermia bacterium]